VDRELAARHYRTHEFGDSLLIERNMDVATCLITDRLGYPTFGLSRLGTAPAR